MKLFIYWGLSVIFVALIIFNATFLNFSDIFSDESFIALMSILATLCALVLLWLLFLSKKMFDKQK